MAISIRVATYEAALILATTPAALAQPAPFAVATYNLRNLSPDEPIERVDALASVIVSDLDAPDVVAVQEVQDSDGVLDSGRVDAVITLARLTGALARAGRPGYQAVSIDPIDDEDGGEPGANIRCALLFRTDRGWQLSPNSSPATTKPPPEPQVQVDSSGQPILHPNPARLRPSDPAFYASRKPLVVELDNGSKHVAFVVVHLKSPLRETAANDDGQTKRTAQADIVARFVKKVREAAPSLSVVVLGDFNTDTGTAPLAVLKGAELDDLVSHSTDPSPFTYDYQGNRSVIDHIFATPELATTTTAFRISHPSGRTYAPSDHAPVVAQFSDLPAVDAAPSTGCAVSTFAARSHTRSTETAPTALLWLGAGATLRARRLRRLQPSRQSPTTHATQSTRR